MGEVKWTAETTAYRMPRAHNPVWAIVYNPTPGGRKNGDGTTTFGMRFPALVLTDVVEEQEEAAKSIAHDLNMNGELAEALELILPMAKGYAHQNRVGNNAKFIEQAESILARARGEGK